MKTRICALILFFTLSSETAFALNIYGYSPPQYTTINQYQSLTFNIGADDPVGLNFAEWYLSLNGGSPVFQVNHDMSGNYDEDSWTYTFNTAGTHNVYAHAYNTGGQTLMTWWQITVTGVQPDLVVQNPNAPTAALPGGGITVSCRVLNQGNASAATSRVGYYLSATPNGTDTFLGYSSSGSLAAGSYADVSAQVTIPSGTPPGNYYITCAADYQDVVAESNEGNNRNYDSITITPLPPDLVVQSPSAPSTACPGQTISVSCVARNSGSGSAAACRMGYYFSQTQYGTQGFMTSTVVPALAANGTSSQNAAFTIPANTPPGTYYVNFFVDDQKAVSESNENNNMNFSQLVMVYPDLVVRNPSAPATAIAGQTIAVSCTAVNQGTACAAGSCRLGWYFSQTQYGVAGFVGSGTVPVLATGGSSSQNASITIPASTAPGIYYVNCFVDDQLAVNEGSGEGNNMDYAQVAVVAPDVVVQNPSAPARACPGQSITVSCIARNQGGASSGTCRMGYYFSSTQYGVQGFMTSTTVPALVPDATSAQSATFQVPSGAPPGTYYVNFFVDDQNVVVESNEGNNMHVAQVYVSAPPVIQSLSPAETITWPAGQPITFSVHGSDQDGLSFAEWYIASDFQVHHNLSGTQTDDAWTYTFSAGVHHVFVYFYDSDNCRSFVHWEVTATDQPDLVVRNPVAPSTACPGQTIDVECTARNQGSGAATACRLGYYLSDTPYSTEGLATWTSVPALPSAGEAAQAVQIQIPSGTVAGTYYVNFFVDDQNVVSESNEGNNMHVAEIQIAPAPTIHVYSPVQTTTAYAGQTLTFKMGTDHPIGLQYTEWYVETTFKEHHNLSGNYAEDSWAFQFVTPGVVHVFVYAYASNGCQSMAVWEVTVGPPAPVAAEFFDDFSYASRQEPVLAWQGWWPVNDVPGPGKARFSDANLDFTSYDGNTVLECRATIEEANWASSRLETTHELFLSGTYAARVWFDDSPIEDRDSTVQTFYAIHRASDLSHAECDFEYLPIYFWDLTVTQPAMDLVTWARGPEENGDYTQYRALSRQERSYAGWRLLLFDAVDGECVRYAVYNDDFSLIGERVAHNRTDAGNADVYPDHLMNISFANWIYNRAADGIGSRSSAMKVDWVYHAADVEMTVARVASTVAQMRAQQVQRRNTMPGMPAVVTGLAVNGGASSTQQRAVILNNTTLYAPTEYRASEDGGFAGAAWLPYLAGPGFQLSAGYGVKTVYLQVRNGAGISSIASDQIEYVETPGGDTTPPGVVTTLAAALGASGAVDLTWAATGDDGSVGIASSYDVRYSGTQITEANWASATPATDEPSPGAPGETEVFTVSGLASGTTYYFALKVADEVPNLSVLSNLATITTLNPVPALATLSPPGAAVGGTGFPLTVNGSNFVSTSVVRWNGTAKLTSCVSSTQLVATIDAADIAAVGTASVTVFNPGPGGGTSNALAFTISSPNPVPTLATLSPTGAAVGGSDFPLTVNGSNFVSSSVVRWNGTAKLTSCVNSTRLVATIEAADIASTGTASVTVFNPAPGGGTSGALSFAVSYPPPALSSLWPVCAVAGSDGFTLMVSGGNFLRTSVVRWNGTEKTPTFVSSSQLAVAINAADIATAGTANVTVFTPTPGGGTSNVLPFSIMTEGSTAAIAVLSPGSTVALGTGFTLTVNGANFVPTSVVRWDGADRSTMFVSSGQLAARIGAADIASARTARVTVFDTAPGGGTTSAVSFAIGDPAQLYSANGHYYEYVPGSYNWDNASAIATARTLSGCWGHLVTITSEAENTFATNVAPLESYGAWIGARSNLAWVTGEAMSGYQNFYQPYGNGGGSCVAMGLEGAYRGMWNGQSCDISTLKLIVEFDGNSVPALATAFPPGVEAGGSGFPLTVNGSNVVSSSVVRWNGTDKPTTFLNSGQLVASISASDIATAGTANVTVFNPTPGGGTSNALTFTIASPTDVGDTKAPIALALHNAAPNPFSPATVIGYDIPGAMRVMMRVLSVDGRVVRTLVDGYEAAGHRSVRWDGRGSDGQTVPSGVYFCRLEAGGHVRTIRLARLK